MKSTISVECKGGYSSQSVWLRKLNSADGENPFQKPYIDHKNASRSGKSGVEAFYFVDDGDYMLNAGAKRWRISVKNGVVRYEKTDRG